MRKKITVAGLNPSIDRTIRVPSLIQGGLNRVSGSVSAAAGKAMNAALALSALGEEALYTGFLYQEGAAAFVRRLAENGVAADCVMCPGAVRVNIKVMDEERGEVTELNEKGTPVPESSMNALREKLLSLAEDSACMVFTGSLPPGAGEDTYRKLMEEVSARGCECVLDADARRLAEGIRAKPFLIKPNRHELEELTGQRLAGLDDIRAAAEALVRGGIRHAAVSLGADGALLSDAKGTVYAPGLKLPVASTVGAGDSMLAGMLSALLGGAGAAEALRLGMGCACARCVIPADEPLTKEEIERYADMVSVRAL